jgi:hypothetical protein
MTKFTILLAGTVVVVSLVAADVLARGGRGGGGGGGRAGGGRAGGGGAARAGGGARPASRPAGNRSPSMSRAAPPAMNRPAQRPAGNRPAASAPRPATGVQRPAANRPAQRPSSGGAAANRPATRPGTGGAVANRPATRPSQPGQRPTQGQLNNFLNMPAGSGRGQVAGSAPGRPAQLPATGGSRGGTITGPGGGQISAGGVGGIRTGLGGAAVGAGVGGIRVTGPGGNSYTKVAGGAAIRGPGGNAVAVGRGASFVNGQFVGGRSWAGVNGVYNRWGYFTPGWRAVHMGAWWPARWALAGSAWAVANWATAGAYCGCTGPATYYDYGQNITYQDGNVYYGDEPVASAEQYYQEAGQIADAGQQAKDEEWLPLGVFAVIAEEGQTQTDKVVQLAVNKDGAIRVNFQDFLADKATTVVGAVDKKTQRVAMRPEGNSSVVVETGLYNLTNDEVPVLVHFGPDRVESRTLIRLQQPEDQPQQ